MNSSEAFTAFGETGPATAKFGGTGLFLHASDKYRMGTQSLRSWAR